MAAFGEVPCQYLDMGKLGGWKRPDWARMKDWEATVYKTKIFRP